MSSSASQYDYRAHLRVQHIQVIRAEEEALLHAGAQVSKVNRLDYIEDSLLDIRESIKDSWNEINQADQADANSNRVYIEWLEKRIKARHDTEEQQGRPSSESEKEEDKESEEDGKEEDNITAYLHHINSEFACEHIADGIVASGQKQTWKVLEKRPARPGR